MTNICEQPGTLWMMRSVPDRKGADIFHKRLLPLPGPLPHPCCDQWRQSWSALPALPCTSIYMHYPTAKLTSSFKDRPKYLTRGFLQLSHCGFACHSEITPAPKHASCSIISSCHPPSNQVVNRLNRARSFLDQNKTYKYDLGCLISYDFTLLIIFWLIILCHRPYFKLKVDW